MSEYICARFSGSNDLVAQLVEQYTFNVWALGSSPSGITQVEEKRGQFICPHLFFINTQFALVVKLVDTYV